MSTQIEFAKNRLFGKGGLDAKNVKFFSGTDRDATPEQYSEQMNMAISQIENGDYTLVEESELDD